MEVKGSSVLSSVIAEAEGSHQQQPGPGIHHPFRETDVEKFVRSLASDKDIPGVFWDPQIMICDRYSVENKIGFGGSANVFKAWDKQKKSYRALKVIRTQTKNRAATERELLITNFILNNDLLNESSTYIVRLYHTFISHRHMFYVYDLLGPSLREVLVGNNGEGFSLQQTQHISLQLISGLRFLHALDVIHHDIKPDNIAFLHDNAKLDPQSGKYVVSNTHVRILDLGSATTAVQGEQKIATTRNYRSPETTLLKISAKESDIWSAGVTLYETFTGCPLFQCSKDEQKCFQLAALLGPIPPHLGKSSHLKGCFNWAGELKYDDTTAEYWVYKSCANMEALMLHYQTKFPSSSPFFHMLKKMIVMERENRWGATQLLGHPFFQDPHPPPPPRF